MTYESLFGGHREMMRRTCSWFGASSYMIKNYYLNRCILDVSTEDNNVL